MDDIDLVVPNSLKMGWCESPLLFCSGSENAQYIMERLRLMDLPPHNFEQVMLQRISRTDTNKNYEGLVTLLEEYHTNFMSVFGRLAVSCTVHDKGNHVSNAIDNAPNLLH